MDEHVDGRRARWDTHRTTKRQEIVEATLRAIRAHGPAVGLDEIASSAKTSKTVIYRHFGDRTGLFVAVVESVHSYILSNLEVHLSLHQQTDPVALVSGLTDAYLSVVARDPDIYRFVVSRPLADKAVADPVTSFTAPLGDRVTEVFAEHLRTTGRDERGARVWGHGVVGCVWAIADAWLATGMARPRAEIVQHVTDLFAPALTPLTTRRPS